MKINNLQTKAKGMISPGDGILAIGDITNHLSLS